MTALGDAVTRAYERGYAAGWYAAQLERAEAERKAQPAAFPLEIERHERA